MVTLRERMVADVLYMLAGLCLIMWLGTLATLGDNEWVWLFWLHFCVGLATALDRRPGQMMLWMAGFVLGYAIWRNYEYWQLGWWFSVPVAGLYALAAICFCVGQMFRDSDYSYRVVSGDS